MLRQVLVVCLLCALAAPAQADESLDISALLAERGTRLLVVEFYATWCKPCMAAMPLWQQLKERYASQGLRIAVVNTQDAEGRCRALPFSPDASICDLEGTIANGLGVGGGLPAAFLWSWQGNLLVQRGHIDAVQQEVERYLRASP
jgi:thiol-disulfide isomerase/thioredoxin